MLFGYILNILEAIKLRYPILPQSPLPQPDESLNRGPVFMSFDPKVTLNLSTPSGKSINQNPIVCSLKIPRLISSHREMNGR